MNKLNYQKKNLVVVSAFVLGLIISWILSISNTVTRYSEVTEMNKKAASAQGAPEQIIHLKEKKVNLDAIFKKYVADSLNQRENVMEIISKYCQINRLTFKNLHELKSTPEEDFTVLTNEMTIEGNFKSLLGLLYLLEVKTSPGRLSCVSFKLEKDNKINKHLLHCHFFIQTLQIQAAN